MKSLEVDKLLEIQELKQQIDELLHLIEQGETVEVTKQGKVIAHLVPEHEPKQSREQELTPFWEKMERLATEIGSYLPDKVDAVEIVREGRREF